MELIKISTISVASIISLVFIWYIFIFPFPLVLLSTNDEIEIRAMNIYLDYKATEMADKMLDEE